MDLNFTSEELVRVNVRMQAELGLNRMIAIALEGRLGDAHAHIENLNKQLADSEADRALVRSTLEVSQTEERRLKKIVNALPAEVLKKVKVPDGDQAERG